MFKRSHAPTSLLLYRRRTAGSHSTSLLLGGGQLAPTQLVSHFLLSFVSSSSPPSCSPRGCLFLFLTWSLMRVSNSASPESPPSSCWVGEGRTECRGILECVFVCVCVYIHTFSSLLMCSPSLHNGNTSVQCNNVTQCRPVNLLVQLKPVTDIVITGS